MNIALHYTDGYGYYEEYKNKRTLVEYGLVPFETNGTTIEKSDLVRRKLVDSRSVVEYSLSIIKGTNWMHPSAVA